MALIFSFALIGLLLGGFRGLVIGLLLGWMLRWASRILLSRGLASVQSQFLDTTFAVMGALSKADGVVTRDEIRAAEALFDRLRLSSDQREAAKAAFERGKATDFDLDGEVDRFARAARGRAFLLQLFLQIELMAVAADGDVHPAEHAMLVRIARRLGMTEHDVVQLEALLRAASQGPAAGYGGAFGRGPHGDGSGRDAFGSGYRGGYGSTRSRAQGGNAGGGPGWGGAYGGPGRRPYGVARSRLDDAYEALGVTPSASEAEIKRAYRRLVSQSHPDKLAGKGLPESMRAIAEEKTRELNAAYDAIKEARGFA